MGVAAVKQGPSDVIREVAQPGCGAAEVFEPPVESPRCARWMCRAGRRRRARRRARSLSARTSLRISLSAAGTPVAIESITAPAAPPVQLRHAALDHRPLPLEALPDGQEAELVKAAECREVRGRRR